MNILFAYRKAIILPGPRPHADTFSILGFTFAEYADVCGIWPELKNGEPRVRYQLVTKSTPHANTYLIEIDHAQDLWRPVGSRRDRADLAVSLESLPAGHTRAFLEESRQIAADLDGYNRDAEQKHLARQEQRKQEGEIRAAREEQRRQEQAAQHERDVATARAAFAKGERISWSLFEDLCQREGVSLHLRTIGAGRRNINAIGPDSINVSNGSKPDKVFLAARDLQKRIQEPAPGAADADAHSIIEGATGT